MADYWVADVAFYGLIRNREVLTAILSEVGGATVAQAHAAEKTKTIKSVINDCLTGDKGRVKVEHWVPLDGVPAIGLHRARRRSEERRVGKECVSTCRSRWSQYH